MLMAIATEDLIETITSVMREAGNISNILLETCRDISGDYPTMRAAYDNIIQVRPVNCR